MKLATSRLKEIIREEIAAVAAALPMPRDVGLGAGPTGLAGLGLSPASGPRFEASRFGVAPLSGDEAPKTYNHEHDILAALDGAKKLWFKVGRMPGDLDDPIAALKDMGYTESADVPVPS